MSHRQIARESALERWNVGYAREWPAEIVTADHVAAALREQAAGAGWHVAEEQLLADAEVIADWLHDERETTA